ncbi:MAG TPA: peptidylprolyl isomerase, partial [Sphaerochaeta sp.]|nr:peptidylprolyl isomerase [Sphaerochaeta sp.]
DVDTYQKATTERKSAIESSIRRNLPYRMVMTDVSTVLASEAEREYVGNMASKVRDFSYLLFDSSLYPDSEAIAYALEHKQLFENIEISIISLGSLEDAEEVASSLQSGLYTFEEAAREHSLDMYAQADGYIGTIPFFAIKPNFRYEDEAAALLGAASGSIVGPFETGGGWAIYRVSTAAEEADVADENTRNLVKTYIGSNEEELMDSYLSNLVTEVSEYAKKTDLVEAALEYDLDLVEVMPTGYNVGKSSFLNNFSYTDPTGMLASYATAEVQTELFTSAEHTLLEPMKTGGAYLLIEVGEDSTDEGMGSYTMMFYDYLAGSQSQENLAQTLYASDLHKDNFLTTFLRVVLGQ